MPIESSMARQLYFFGLLAGSIRAPSRARNWLERPLGGNGRRGRLDGGGGPTAAAKLHNSDLGWRARDFDPSLNHGLLIGRLSSEQYSSWQRLEPQMHSWSRI